MLKFDRRGRGAWASFLQARIKPWEYGLGDKAYVGQRQIITEWKVWAMELAESTTSPQRSLFSDTKTHPTIATCAGAAK